MQHSSSPSSADCLCFVVWQRRLSFSGFFQTACVVRSVMPKRCAWNLAQSCACCVAFVPVGVSTAAGAAYIVSRQQIVPRPARSVSCTSSHPRGRTEHAPVVWRSSRRVAKFASCGEARVLWRSSRRVATIPCVCAVNATLRLSHCRPQTHLQRSHELRQCSRRGGGCPRGFDGDAAGAVAECAVNRDAPTLQVAVKIGQRGTVARRVSRSAVSSEQFEPFRESTRYLHKVIKVY